MTDLTKLLKEIQRDETSHVDMHLRMAKGTLQWFLENDKDTHPIHQRNRLQFLMCGEEGFNAIEKDIRGATSTIDLVLWGFDPGMELVRSAQKDNAPDQKWPRGATYGDLLSQKGRAGVKVRMLLWYDVVLSNLGANNVHDLPLVWLEGLDIASGVVAPTQAWLESNKLNLSPLKIRADYCTAWWRAALRGGFPNLEVRMRQASYDAISANIAKYLPDQRALIEALALDRVGTHHQKPLLIDYAAPAIKGQKPTACAYVMGFNSVTDYWDTSAHLYNDRRRELSTDGQPTSYIKWHRKPYRDYAIRVQGQALFNINENFVQGWDSARRPPSSLDAPGVSLHERRKAIQAKDIASPADAGQRAQIVRTQPEKLDATILKAYTLASSNAVNYIYAENQYFQLADWPRLVKDIRARYCTGLSKAGCKPGDVAPLHLFVVMPQAEKSGMVPRTYEAVGQLGAGDGMAAYHQKVQGVRKGAALPRPQGPHEGQPGAKADYQRRMREWYAASHGADGSSIVQDSVAALPANPQAELQALGIRPLVAMLMSFDGDKEAKKIRISQRDNDAQTAQAKNEAAASKNGRASDVDDYGVDIIPRPYREIYIHSKLMFVDDVYTTLGSANLNVRSMASDSELNICTDDYAFTQAARKRVWANIAGPDLDGGDGGFVAMAQTHKDWIARMKNNKSNRIKTLSPENGSFIHPFEDPRGEPLVRVM